MLIHTRPVPKPRMTRSDKWSKRKCVMDYYSYKDRLLEAGVVIPARCRVVFGIPTKDKRLWGTPHMKRPDVDNLLKGLMDAVKEDGYVHNVHVSKVYSEDGFVMVEEL